MQTRSRKGLAVGGALAVLVVGGLSGWFVTHRSTSPEVRAVAAVAAATGSDPFALGSSLAPIASQLARDATTPSARLRRVAELLQNQKRAGWVGAGEMVPPPRSPDLVWALLASPTQRVTELDVARLATALLRGAGDATATLALRRTPRRPEAATDETGSLGAWLVKVGDQVLDVGPLMVIGAAGADHEVVEGAHLSAAIAAQAAMEVAPSAGGRGQALSYAEAAVEGWREGWVPLAARARVWVMVGASSGLEAADRDLQAAIAMRDDAGLHVARARVLLGQNRIEETATEVMRAQRMAPAFAEAAMAAVLLQPVFARMDAGSVLGCEGLHRAQGREADDAYALCADGVSDDVRRAAAERMMAGTSDPLRAAYAARRVGVSAAATLRARFTGAAERNELVRWLSLAGADDVVRAMTPEDGGL